MSINFPVINDNIKKDYSKEAHSQILKFYSDNFLLSRIKGRTLKTGVTIDSRTSEDLDDGICAYEHDYGYVIEVSIADVAEYVEHGSALDKEALNRVTSIYYRNCANYMFPRNFTINNLSLNDNTTRLTLTVTINLDKNYEVINSSISETFFKNTKRYDYKSFMDDYNDRNHQNFTNLRLFYKIATNLYNKRKENFIVDDFKDDDRSILVDVDINTIIGGKKAIKNLNGETILKDMKESKYKQIPSFIVQEFSIIANKEVSKITNNISLSILHRNHMPDNFITKTMEENDTLHRAFYSEVMKGHLGLAEEFYCHFTSPIRRYADLIVHRQIKSFLRTGEPFYKEEEIKSYAIYINEKIYRIKLNQNKAGNIPRVKKLQEEILHGNKLEELSHVSIHSFEKIIFKNLVSLETKKIPLDVLKLEINRRIKENLITDKTLFYLLFSNYIDDLNNIYDEVKLVTKDKGHFLFMDFLKKLPGSSSSESFRYEDGSNVRVDDYNNYYYKYYRLTSKANEVYRKNVRASGKNNFVTSDKTIVNYRAVAVFFYKGTQVLKTTVSGDDLKKTYFKASFLLLKKIIKYFKKNKINVFDVYKKPENGKIFWFLFS